MNERIAIAKELVNMAKELMASDYRHRNDYTDADAEEHYASELADTIYDHFKNGRLDEKVVDYVLKVSPKRFLKKDAKTDAQKKSYDVRVIMFYYDEATLDDMPCEEARMTYRRHCGGEAYNWDMNNLVMIATGYLNDEECDESWFHNTFMHEMMHILDACAYEYAFHSSDSFGKRTKHEEKRNLCPAYPSDNDDMLNPKFAEYFTCEGEMREYRSSLRNSIREYCRATDTEWKDAIAEIKNALENEKKFRKYYDSFYGNYSPLATLYHLCFSNPSHGNRQTAMKLLDGLKEEL